MTAANTPQARADITPLPAVTGFTFLNSLGGGVVTTGFAFLAEAAYRFSPVQNYMLGLLQGVVYVIGALAVGPALARAIRTVPGVTTRRTLALLMLALGFLSSLPWLARRFGDGSPTSGAWAIWVLIGGYSTLTGVLWPIVESYLSGGRSGPKLRSSIGVWNVVWSSALVAAYWLMGPLKKDYSLELVLAVAAMHLLCTGVLPLFARNPAAHVEEHHAPVPEAYPRLLGVFRMQLATSYLVFSALTPFLPLACRRLELPDHLQTPIASAWLAARVVTFAVMQRWHGWHGRWATAGWGAGLLLAGFGGAVMSSTIGVAIGTLWGITTLVLGLAVFGVGMGVIYCAALYYAMAVGNAQVDAGGKHEALIGIGYGSGPVFGLLALGAGNAGLLAPGTLLHSVSGGHFEVLMLILVAVAASLVVGTSLWQARSHHSSQGRQVREHPAE